MPNKNCKAAVDATERYSDGNCKSELLQMRSEKILSSIGRLSLLGEVGEYAAEAAAWVSSKDNFKRTAEVTAVAHGVNISLDNWEYERQLEQGQQAILFREILGNPFRPSAFHRRWLTPTVTYLATIAYEERALPSGKLDTTRLAILADALEETGCDNQEILGHLRSPGPHFRGCHVLDLLLGKE